MSERILIVGATSAIAHQVSRQCAQRGAALFLCARDPQRLKAAEIELLALGASSVSTYACDLTEYTTHASLVNRAIEALHGLDAVLIAHGILPDQRSCQDNVELMRSTFDVNLLSTVSLLTVVANHFEAERHGRIVVIGSVAGDRGRQSNYVYGAAKAGLETFVQGMRNRLHAAGVHVVLVKPGFVDTPMTATVRKNRLFASAEQVGKDIYRAVATGKPDVLYTPRFWWAVMLGIRLVPEPLFKRLRL